jgi:hypothetical protein
LLFLFTSPEGRLGKQEITQQEGLKNAPKRDPDYFKVPKIIEKYPHLTSPQERNH